MNTPDWMIRGVVGCASPTDTTKVSPNPMTSSANADRTTVGICSFMSTPVQTAPSRPEESGVAVQGRWDVRPMNAEAIVELTLF